MTSQGTVVHAEPQKTFFIDMLTRDIGLIECILDLIDNSIHNLIRTSKANVMALLSGQSGRKQRFPKSVAITISKDKFSIADNCGGIERQDAINDVFLFGKKQQVGGQPGLGLYGVGMKRALFKLGRDIEVKSWTKDDAFRVPIDVDHWRKEKDWELRLYNITKKREKSKLGVSITVKNLNDVVTRRLNTSGFTAELSERIASAYSLFLSSGLTISINGHKVISDMPEFETKAATPARREYRFGKVSVLIVAGLTPKNHRRPEGWYVFCNGRLILPRDQSSATGWGVDQYFKYHSKFNHFLGTVYFTSTELDELPWTTTKQEVNLDSPAYQKALVEMKLLARPVLSELGKLYPTEVDEETIIQRELFTDSKSTPITKLSKKQSTFSLTKQEKPKAIEATISFKRLKTDVSKVKLMLGSTSMSNKEVGERVFDYYMEMECE